MALVIIFQLLLAVASSVLAEIEMEFTRYPESVTAPVGDQVTFECAVRVPGERLAWRWKSVDQSDGPWKDVGGVGDKDTVSTRLVVDIKEDTPSSLYQCVVWYGAVSLASIPARLSIARLDLSRNSPRRRMITAPTGNTVVLHCKEPLSEPPALMSWWKDTGKNTRRQLDTPYGVLVIHNASESDSGTYGCTATNELSGQVLDLPETTYLKVQNENGRGVRFLEDEDFVGTIDNEGVLTMPIRPNGALRLWCGAVDSSPPRVTWTKEGEIVPRHHEQAFYIASFTSLDEGIYTCTANPAHPIRRSWKVIALEPPRWEDSVANVNATEGSSAHIACGTPYGQPPPKIHWMLNAEPLKTGKGIRTSGSDLFIEHVEKRHAGIVQCFACNDLGCAYDAALLTVVPMQISDQQYQAEAAPMHFPSQPPKRHNRKSPRKHKAVLVPPSRPNITRMSDTSVMVSWSHDNHGLPIQFYKIQYREILSNSTSNQWHTESIDIPPHIHSYEVDSLIPDRFYKFRVAAVYSNQDNKSGRASYKFHLKRGGPKGPPAPVLTKAVALSTDSIQLNWTWSEDSRSDTRDPVIGFYVYFRALSTAGEYDKVISPVKVRSMVLRHLAPDTAYELKLQAYTEQAPSEFSSILVAKTQKLLNATSSTESPPDEVKSESRSPDALVTAGGALGVAALLGVLGVTLLLCRRAKRPPSNSEYESPPDEVKSESRSPDALVTAGGALGVAALLGVLGVTLLLCRRAKRPPSNSEYESPPDEVKSESRSPDALVTAGGALGVAALLGVLGVTLLLCRRAKRPPSNSEYESPPDEVKSESRSPDALVTAGGALGVAALLGVLGVTLLLCRRAKRPPSNSEYESPPDEVKSESRSPDALVTAGGALGVAALLGVLGVTLLLCRRAKRPPSNKEKGSVPESGATNGYIPAKVPITITANPMHTEGGDSGVEMSFLHNNNTGSNDDTLPHSRKNGPANRQYV